MNELIYHPNSYLAFVLDQRSRAALLEAFPPRFAKVLAHHVTIEFALTPQRLVEHIKVLGLAPRFHVIGHAVGDGIECVAVSVDGRTERRDGSFYHITLSLQPPRKPVDSNNLKREVELIRGFMKLDGQLKVIPK